MINVLLIHKGSIPHYRILVYSYLYGFLHNYDFELTVVSEGIEESDIQKIEFPYIESNIGFAKLASLLLKTKPDIVIFWIGLKPYIIPILILAKFLRIKVIHWGHRTSPPHSFLKKLIYNFEHWLDDAVILYSEEYRKYVFNCFQSKTFIANNTLNLTSYNIRPSTDKDLIKDKYGINANKNIICMGRMQQRKRINDLVQAFLMLDMKGVGLILAGPDSDGLLTSVNDENIIKVGAVYGQESLDLLSISDVYCIPGAVGLSIVDAFYCGLPVVTENVLHGPEIMYLKNGVNGFVVPEGDIAELAAKLRLLLTDDPLRAMFSNAAKQEISTNGNIDRMCEGFLAALTYV